MLCLAYALCGHNFQMIGVWKNEYEYSTIQVDYQTEKQYIVAMFLNIEVVI